MSKSKKQVSSEEKRLNYSNCKKGEKNPMYGRSGSKSPVAKKVSQFLRTGEFVKTYDTATEAGRILGISQKNISSCCTGKWKTAGGFIWKHHTD